MLGRKRVLRILVSWKLQMRRTFLKPGGVGEGMGFFGGRTIDAGSDDLIKTPIHHVLIVFLVVIIINNCIKHYCNLCPRSLG